MEKVVSLLVLWGWLSLSAHALGPRPNVLLILVDDLKPVLGAYGDLTAKTPHLDALVARGMRFDAAYCNQAVCAPSRFTLMLGSHSTSTGLHGLGSDLRTLVPEAVTLPQYFARVGGYRTESLGKVFHIGHGNHGDPGSFSVPHFKDKVVEYMDPASTDGGKLTREEALFTNEQLGNIRDLPRGAAYEWPEVPDDAYADGRVAAETLRRLQAARDRRAADGTPFFIAAGFARPHMPFTVPKKYWDLYDPAHLPMPVYESLPEGAPAVAGKRGGEIAAYQPVPERGPFDESLKRTLIHGYYASTSYVDTQIGMVLDGLHNLGLEDNTIVVLWGDHGFHLGDLGIWTKHTNYEQANRIPLCIVAPGIVPPGSATGQLAETVDLYPTLAALAGLPAPRGPQPMDGVNLLPVLQDPHVRVRDHAYHAYPKQKLGRAIRTERYRLVEWKTIGAADSTAEFELYDYEADPLETRNLAAEHPGVVARLKTMLDRHPAPYDPKAPPQPGPAKEPSPQVVGRALEITAEVQSDQPQGVVLAQGGVEQGYALHFLEGRPAFDVRLDGKVTRVMAPDAVRGKLKLKVTWDAEEIRIFVNGQPAGQGASPGLLAVQPKDALSVGLDLLSPAGDYSAPNPFQGVILRHQVK